MANCSFDKISIFFFIMPNFSSIWRWVIDFWIKFSKYNLMMTIWMKGGWTPDSATICGCYVNIKSIPEKEFCNKCVGSFINWCNPNWEVILSTALPSKLVLSWLYQLQDLALKSPIIVARKEPSGARVSNVISRLSIMKVLHYRYFLQFPIYIFIYSTSKHIHILCQLFRRLCYNHWKAYIHRFIEF